MEKIREMKFGPPNRCRVILLLLQVLLSLLVLPGSAFSSLNDSYFFTVTSNNDNGVESVDFAVVDANAPIPAALDIIPVSDVASNNGIVSLRVNAPENVGLTKAQFLVNGSLAAESVASPHAFSWDTSALSRGDYTVSVKAFDSAGNEAVSEDVAVQVVGDITPPIVTLIVPVNGSAAGTLVVSASANDNVHVARIELYLDDVMVVTADQNTVSYDWNTSTGSNGGHVLSAKAYDAAGNVGQSANVTVTVLNDTTIPTVSLSPAGGTVGGTVAVTANATDNVAVTKVEFYVNGALQSTSASAPFSFSWNTKAVSNGSYTLSAKAYDAAGNIGQSADVAVTVFNDPAPTVSIASPLADSTVGGSVTVSASATDNVGVTKVEFFVNGVLKATDTLAPFSYTWNTKTIANGSCTLGAKAYDAKGNVGQSADVTVNVFNDAIAPTVSIDSPLNNSTASGSVTVSALASDDVAVTKVQFFVNGVLKATDTSAPYTYTWDTKPIANGSYTLSAKAYDATGKVGQSASVIVKVYNDKTVPTVSIVSPTANSTAAGSVTVSANATDNVAVTKVEFYVNSVLKATVDTASSNFTWNTTVLANGTYTLSAKAYDAAGNVGQSSNIAVKVLNDATAPTVNFLAPTSNYVYGNSVSISASATDNVAVTKMQLYVDNSLKYTTTGSSFNFGASMTVGVHTITVKAYDAANNVKVSSKTVNRFY